MSALNNFLLGIPLFHHLGPMTITELAEESTTLKFRKGAIILEEGEECRCLYLVASGKLEAYHRFDDDIIVVHQTFSPGEAFGETYFLNGLPSAESLRAASNTVVVTIDRGTVESVLKDNLTFLTNTISLLTANILEKSKNTSSLLSILLAADLHIPEPFVVLAALEHEDTSGALDPDIQDHEKEGDAADPFFQKEISCPLCNQIYHTFKARHKYTIIERTDEDSCPYYKTINPLFYEINSCPNCGYSFNSSTDQPVRSEVRNAVGKVLSQHHRGENYSGTRTLEDAVQTFVLATQCQRQMGADDYALGRLHLKLGWLYRYQGNPAQEEAQMKKALYHLSKYYDQEDIQDHKEEMNIMFLIGQIHLNLKDENGALHWFIRITQHPERKKYPYMVNRSSELWQEIRREQKSNKQS